MNVLKTITVTPELSFFNVASAIGEIRIMRMIALEDGNKEPKPIEMAMDAIMEVLGYKFRKLFQSEFPQYANNKIQAGGNCERMEIRVLDEKCDEPDDYDDCDDCREMDEDDSMDISEILKNSGLETSDDHVERLADDLRNKRGGKA